MTAGSGSSWLEMTVFEVGLMLLLQGNGGIFQLIITVLSKAVEKIISEMIKPVVMPLISEQMYYIAEALV